MDTPSLSDLLNALRDPTRRTILRRLEQGERPCSAFSDLGSKTSRSYHFAILRQTGLTGSRREGTSLILSYHPEAAQAAYPGVLEAVLRADREEDASPRAPGRRPPV